MITITDKEYEERVLARCSQVFHGHLVDVNDLTETLKEFIEAGQRLDRIKKSVFYGKPFEYNIGGPNLPVEEPINLGSAVGNMMMHAILGVATEAVELCEALANGIEHPEEFDIVNLAEEFGDLNWYRTLGLAVLNQTHKENITINDNKLEKRYGATFSADRALERDLDAERATLEGKE